MKTGCARMLVLRSPIGPPDQRYRSPLYAVASRSPRCYLLLSWVNCAYALVMADAFLTECIKYELDSVVWLAHRVFPSWAMAGLPPSLTASAERTPDSMAPSIQACFSEVCSPAK